MPQDIKLPKNPALAWLQESPSVMDASWEAPLKGLLNIFGSPDDLPIPEVGGGPLVSIFKNKGLREQATKEFVNAAEGISSTVGEAAKWLAMRHPRIAAHVDLRARPKRGAESPAPAYMVADDSKLDQPVEVFIDPKANKGGARDMLAHEMTHTAQHFGNKDFGRLYDLSEQIPGGRDWQNPFENSAILRGSAASINHERVARPENALRALRALAEKHPNLPAAQEVLEIINRRTGGGGPPSVPSGEHVVGMAGIPKAVREKRALVTDEGILKEIKDTAKLYNEAKASGDTQLAREAGKRLAELQRLGTGGKAFTPSSDKVTTDSLLPPSQAVMNARIKAQLEAAKQKK